MVTGNIIIYNENESSMNVILILSTSTTTNLAINRTVCIDESLQSIFIQVISQSSQLLLSRD